MNTMNLALTAEQTAPHELGEWINVCDQSDLAPDTGLCALIKQQQIAIFYSRRLEEIFAINNYDPIGKANVLSRGIIGSLGDAVVVASPLYKQHFDLRTGECLEAPEHKVGVYPVRIHEDAIQVQI
jgi:nitrite reductase (NADH) small subunit